MTRALTTVYYHEQTLHRIHCCVPCLICLAATGHCTSCEQVVGFSAPLYLSGLIILYVVHVDLNIFMCSKPVLEGGLIMENCVLKT